METLQQRQTVKQELMILLAVTTIAFAGYWQAAAPYYMSKSKIEEGTEVTLNDTTKTILIPDRR